MCSSDLFPSHDRDGGVCALRHSCRVVCVMVHMLFGLFAGEGVLSHEGGGSSLVKLARLCFWGYFDFSG